MNKNKPLVWSWLPTMTFFCNRMVDIHLQIFGSKIKLSQFTFCHLPNLISEPVQIAYENQHVTSDRQMAHFKGNVDFLTSCFL
jgi:hypothetical protein